MQINIFDNRLVRNELWLGIIFIAIVGIFLVFSQGLNSSIVGPALIGLALIISFTLNPVLGVLAMTFLLPETEWHIYVLGFKMALIEVVSFMAMSGFLIRHFFVDKLKKKIKFPLLTPFILFFISMLISSWLSHNFIDSLWYAIRWVLFFYIFYVVLPFNVIKTKKDLYRIIIVFALAGVLVSVFGIVSLIEQDFSHSLVRVKPIQIFGIYPMGETQNMMVEPLLPAVFFLLFLKKINEKDKLLEKLLNLAFIFALFVLIATFSRGAWLALIFSALIYAILAYRKQIVKMLMPILIAMIILIPLGVQMYRLQTAYDVGVSSTNSRLLMSKIAYDSFLDYKIFGKGPGEFINTIGSNIRFRSKFGDPMEAHGVYLKLMLENGIVGILTFSLILLAFFKDSVYALKNKFTPELLLLFLSAFSVIFFEMFDVSYYKAKLWLPIAIALIAYSVLNQNDKMSYAKN